MRNQKSTTSVSRKWLLVIAVAVLALAAAGAYAAYTQKQRGKTKIAPSPTVNYSPASPADNKAIDDRKNQPPPTATPVQSTATVKITGVNVQSGNVHVGTLVSNATTGSCALTATQAGQNSLQLATSSVHLDVNAYGCGVFNIPTSKFPSPGKWQLALTVTNGSDKVTDIYDVTIP